MILVSHIAIYFKIGKVIIFCLETQLYRNQTPRDFSDCKYSRKCHSLFFPFGCELSRNCNSRIYLDTNVSRNNARIFSKNAFLVPTKFSVRKMRSISPSRFPVFHYNSLIQISTSEVGLRIRETVQASRASRLINSHGCRWRTNFWGLTIWDKIESNRILRSGWTGKDTQNTPTWPINSQTAKFDTVLTFRRFVSIFHFSSCRFINTFYINLTHFRQMSTYLDLMLPCFYLILPISNRLWPNLDKLLATLDRLWPISDQFHPLRTYGVIG